MNIHMPKQTRGPKPEWSDADVETLKSMVAAGKSYGDIAMAIPHSRVSCIGKSHRLHLVQGARAEIPKAKRAAFVPNALVPLKREPFRAGKPTSTIIDDIEGIGLVELTADTCRWPLWTDETAPVDKRFCGAHAADGSSYCQTHHRRSRAAA
jgi:hypothetical protein